MPYHAYKNMFPLQVYFMEIELLSIWKVLHEDLFWCRGKGNLKMASWHKIKRSLIAYTCHGEHSLNQNKVLCCLAWPQLSLHLLIKYVCPSTRCLNVIFLHKLLILTCSVSLTAKQNYNIQFYKNLREKKKIISITKELGSLTSCLYIFSHIISKQFINQTSTHVIFKITPEVSLCQLLFHIISL